MLALTGVEEGNSLPCTSEEAIVAVAVTGVFEATYVARAIMSEISDALVVGVTASGVATTVEVEAVVATRLVAAAIVVVEVEAGCVGSGAAVVAGCGAEGVGAGTFALMLEVATGSVVVVKGVVVTGAAGKGVVGTGAGKVPARVGATGAGDVVPVCGVTAATAAVDPLVLSCVAVVTDAESPEVERAGCALAAGLTTGTGVIGVGLLAPDIDACA